MRWGRSLITLVIALAAGFGFSSPAQASARTDFIAKLVPGAQALQRQTGIPASVTIAMAALETGWGRSSMASSRTVDGATVQINTLFNIKCTSYVSPYQTGCVPISTAEYTASGSSYKVVARFRTYASWNDSMRDYGRLLTTASRYKPAFQYTAYPDQFVTEVRKGGYATDPRYAQLVINIMRQYGLYQYNTNGAKGGTPSSATPPASTPSPTPAPKAAATVAIDSTYPVYKRGNKAAGIKTLQGLLNAKAKAGLAADGSFGAKTEKAVRAWQAKKRLRITGIVDAATWRSLTPSIKPGMRGVDVKQLQSELIAAGAKVKADGVYGTTSQNAVRDIQRKARLTVDAVVGPRTWAVLIRR